MIVIRLQRVPAVAKISRLQLKLRIIFTYIAGAAAASTAAAKAGAVAAVVGLLRSDGKMLALGGLWCLFLNGGIRSRKIRCTDLFILGLSIFGRLTVLLSKWNAVHDHRQHK